jgi:hypothetical protein
MPALAAPGVLQGAGAHGASRALARDGGLLRIDDSLTRTCR